MNTKKREDERKKRKGKRINRKRKGRSSKNQTT
jgi:hypothetical protein